MAVLDAIDRMSEWVGRIVSFLILIVIFTVSYEIVLRGIFGSPTVWTYELGIFLFGGYCLLGGAYTLYHKGHINVDVVYRRVSPRWRCIFDLVTSILFFSFCGVLAWQGWEWAMRSVMVREYTISPWAPPLYPFKLSLPIGASLILLQGLANLVRELITVVTGKEGSK